MIKILEILKYIKEDFCGELKMKIKNKKKNKFKKLM